MSKLARKLSQRGSDELIEGDSPTAVQDVHRSSLRVPSKALRTPSKVMKGRREERKARRAAKQKQHGSAAGASGAEHTDASDTEDERTFRAEWHMSRADERRQMRVFIDNLQKNGLLRMDFEYHTYRRFLRARQHDIDRATEMWRNHLDWRKSIGADTILEDFEFPERDAFISLYPQGYCNVDKMGRPVYIQQLGKLQFSKLCELTSEERMLKFHVQEYERCLQYIMPACSKTAGRHIEQTFAILDVKGVGWKHLTGSVKRMLGTVLEVDQNNYPEMLGKTAIINGGSIINWVFPIVKPFLDKRTQNKIEVCPRDFTPTLLKYIDRENLPEFLGGTSQATLLDDAGPWNDKALVDEIDAQKRKVGPRLVMPDDGPGPGSVASSEVGGASPKALDSFSHPAARNGGARITEEDESFFEVPPRASSKLSADSMQSAISAEDGYASAADGYASASEGYWSAAESVASMRSAASRNSRGSAAFDSALSFRAAPPGEPRDSDSDDEATSKSPGPAAFSPAAASMVGGPSPTAPQQLTPPEVKGLGATAAAAPVAVTAQLAASPRANQQQSIAARVKALEERLGRARQGLGSHAPPPPSDTGSSAPLLSRVEALEAAMDTMLAAQQQVMEEEDKRSQTRGCCGCVIM